MGVTTTGLDRVIENARARAERARNLGPALRVIAEQVATALDDRFRTGTDFEAQPWAPNRPATIKRKGSSKPGIDTGRERESITAQVVGNDTVRFGTNVPYAGPVAFGYKRTGTLKHPAYPPGLGKVRGKRVAGPRHGARREAGTSYAFGAPARNPFPVNAAGHWIDSPLTQALLRKAGKTLSTYILTGRV